MKKNIHLRIHFIIFSFLIVWTSVRVTIDLGDMEYLKQITIATTGGMLLFYFLGAFLSITYQSSLVNNYNGGIAQFVLTVFFILQIWTLYNFSHRLHPHLFYLLNIDGSYQRAGDFLSISFIIFSYFYLAYIFTRIGRMVSKIAVVFWMFTYTVSTLMALVSSQLFGSNSATAVIIGVYLITFVMALIIPKKAMLLSYLRQQLVLPWRKQLIKQFGLMAIFVGGGSILLVVAIISATNFDITSLRLLGFGTGTNSSLSSRVEILLETGVNQLGYAPILGNMNVAYITTGDSGLTLHSFFPYVMANLGLVGLTLVLMIFTSIIFQLYYEARRGKYTGFISYKLNMVALYSMFIFIYILFFANIATGVSWSVLWFTLGFISKPFYFSERV
ncbi:hypothetical protein CUC53_03475 [Aeromonas cavernicola]|uniref:Oligosaccharide repeat unit polymerase n=1 Tax=Aeromonas cavernicola TaxID=1006623 RepID=A0A2H9U842_9GAMM|nr:hypothetical protein CUC53_03475 [Aeromonas cavernicola]